MGHHYEHFYLDPKFWVAVSFVIFVVLVGRAAWARVASFLDGRAERVKAELDEAARLRAEAAALLQQAEADRATALAEAKEMLERAQAEARRVAEAAALEAEASTKQRERMALDRIAAAQAGAIAEVRNAAADIAVAAARHVIADRIDAKADAKLITKAVTALPEKLRA